MKKIIFVLFFCLSILLLTGCGKTIQKYDGDIQSFRYYYGSFNGGYYEYDISVEDGVPHLVAKGMNGVDLDFDKDIDASYVEKLNQVIQDNNLGTWDGFDKADNGILDGYSFTLEVHYTDGKKLSAHGYMKYPKNYDKVHEEFEDILKDIQ